LKNEDISGRADRLRGAGISGTVNDAALLDNAGAPSRVLMG
jgi:hypothetical protein